MSVKPTLNDALAAWGKADLPKLSGDAAGDNAALARILQHADAIAAADVPSRRPWWALGGAVAASVALALLLSPSIPGRQSQGDDTDKGAAPVMLADASGTDSAAFALLYTPTSEEEYQL
ncbi:MAG: hypothetical protein DI568_08455 [Sphingomonas sp.]|nr:MAG: hypothetical protein DI568_08455 [Sphingomonas sp.]